ncbi:MAG: hypothetical protein AB7G93_09015 [Bdellovibrionales bacterium]
MPVDTREMERTPTSSPEFATTESAGAESLKVRCPQCRKLYLVAFTDIHEAKPRFECVQCRSRFWLSLADVDLSAEVEGLPLPIKAPPLKLREQRREPAVPGPAAKELEPCPKCFRPSPVGAHECPHCGVMIDKLKSGLSFTDSVPAHSNHLNALWKKVVADYANEDAHAEFLRASQRERNLAYAAAQYGQMEKLMPADETTRRRVREIQALGTAMLPPPVAKRKRPLPIYRIRAWQIPMIIAVFLMAMGVVSQVFRNMVGVGAAFLFLALALKIHLRRRD